MRLGSNYRETRRVPEGVASPEVLETFLGVLAKELAPGLEASVNAVEWRKGDHSGSDWSAEGHLEDGTLVVLVARPSEGSITLLVDNAPPLKPALLTIGRWTYLGVGGVLSLGFAAGTWADNALSGTLVSVSLLVGWVALEISLQRRKQRAARARPLDVELWRRRFDAAVAFAGAQVLPSSSPP